MEDPLAQAFADLPESSESEGEQSDAQSSEEEEELDSEEEAVKKLVRAAPLPATPSRLRSGPACLTALASAGGQAQAESGQA